ncbi:putative PLP-dependent enzyme possibly involved in cell wall biogenesis [Terriglobus roseus DSM 18391]|uniref:Putative PLP-dependent enzyme possibly involved in cell wall biogenesis n=1 Tax=Terriglobus roseus (strain DSM 18391 / NRRL B-41598 / KBS 63) TaxID=926566 RepID=I3ZCZ5_TERRK|nr:DegT/DnrJ/EryC1/StrS family aminotransferase [Terriglobus roseus]AFL87113.1 putative PLP-dependent enzyme possibly involved in cell wall biogenesis [Terriglobus roseus DSM 18391]
MSAADLAPVPTLDLSRQYAAVGEQIARAVADVCSAGRFILGREVGEFETAVARTTAASEAVGCASGTDALWLALAALRIGEGAAVVTTPFSFFATVSSILRAGARPVLADIDPVSFNLSADAVAEAVRANPDTRAIMPVHLYGQCADWDALAPVAAQNNLLLIEDAAQAFGASWNGVQAGALGDAAAFSFYPTKNLSAWGDAGLTTFRDAATGELARALRAHGMRRRYYHDEVGWNSRLDTVQAAVLLIKMQYIAQWNDDRRRVAERYAALFADTSLVGSVADGGIVLPTADPRGVHVWHQYVIRTPRRDDLRAHLTAHGIGSEVYYPVPLHMQDALRDLGYREGQFPESEKAAREVLALPIYPELREDEQVRVVEAIHKFFA